MKIGIIVDREETRPERRGKNATILYGRALVDEKILYAMTMIRGGNESNEITIKLDPLEIIESAEIDTTLPSKTERSNNVKCPACKKEFDAAVAGAVVTKSIGDDGVPCFDMICTSCAKAGAMPNVVEEWSLKGATVQ